MDAFEPNVDDAEFYETPGWCVRRLLEGVDLCGAWWLDPCVGEGAIPRVLPGVRWGCFDIRRTAYTEANPDSCIVGDYLAMDLKAPASNYSVALFNPPFSKALEFVKQAYGHCRIVAMLHRMSWVGSAGRIDPDWMNAHPFSEHLLPNRVSFTGDGRSDAQEYQWHVWPPQPGPRVLAQTSLEERKGDTVPARERSQVEMWPGFKPDRARFLEGET